MSELDLAPLRTALTPFATHGRTALLPALHAAQKIYGWLPEPVATAVLKGETALGRAEPARAADLIAGTGNAPGGIVGGDLRRLTLNCGRGRATTLPEYEASGGYAA